MIPIATLVSMLSSAANVVGAFKGSAAQAKTTSTVQDAISIIGAVTPLVQQFGSGQEVTSEQVRQALVNMDTALDQFDAEIARQQQNQP